MRKADLVNKISEETGIPKVDTLVVIESMIKEDGYNVYLRGFGSFVVKTTKTS